MDPETEKIDRELLLYIKSKQDRFEYAFTALAFASLALSFQYSPQMGTNLPFTLIASWVLFMISAFCGGWRLLNAPTVDWINRCANVVESFIRQRMLDLSNPSFVAALEAGYVRGAETLKTMSLKEAKEGIKTEEENKKLAEKLLREKNRKMIWTHKIQVWTYLVGMLLNGIFVTANYITKVFTVGILP